MDIVTLPAFRSGTYRNLFKETGKTDAEIDAKVNGAVRDFFRGEDSIRCYREFGTDEAFILDSGNDDIRSEGMSYGMMIAVQTGLREEFDRLWNFTLRRMRHADGDRQGYFAWQLNTDGTMRSRVSAPDGEEYFAMALFFAWKRWADPAYKAAADDILHHMLHQDIYAALSSGVTRMIDPGTKQIVFVPEANGSYFTDPSYHLPAFYELFSLWANEDNAYWKEVAAASRDYLGTAAHPVTGLYPDYSTFDGKPMDPSAQGHEDFRNDAWRVIQNIAVDWAWFGADPRQIGAVDRIQAFFAGRGLLTPGSQFALDGKTVYDSFSPPGLAASNPRAMEFVRHLWDVEPTRGKWRYYNGCLYVFGLLHCSGKFRIIGG